MNPAIHAQTAWPFDTRQWLFGPQRDGLHGSTVTVSVFNDDHYVFLVSERKREEEWRKNRPAYEPWRGVHDTNAFPVMFLGQLHIGR